MKNLKKLTAFSIVLVIVSMVIALFQFKKEENSSLLPEQFEYYFDEGWSMISLDISEEELENQDRVQELIENTIAKEKHQKVTLPYKEIIKNNIIVFKNTLSEEYTDSIMSITSNSTVVLVWLDGDIIYQNEPKTTIVPENVLKNKEHFIDIPNTFQNGELWIELVPSDPNIAITLDNVKIKTDGVLVLGIIGNNITDIVCCLLIVIMAIIMFTLASIRRYTSQPNRGELFLGFASLFAGIYCFIETNTLSIFYNLDEAYEVQEYLMLLLPLFLALYFSQNMYVIYPRRFSLLLWCVNSNAIIQILLQILKIQYLQNMKIISILIVNIICILVIVCLLQLDYKNKYHNTLLIIISSFILLLGGIIDIITRITFINIHITAANQYTITIFYIIMAIVHILQLSKEYQASAERNALILSEKVKITEQQNIQLLQAKKEADIARHEALAANEAKGRFLAHMSHEIRTPINAVLGMDEMILRESKEQTIKEYAMDIYTAGQTLLSLINDILDFSKIESGKMEIVPVEYDVSSVIHDLSNMTSQRAKDKNLKLEVKVDSKIPSQLYGDDVRIRQVLTNILTNAVKYTQEGTIWLRVQNKIIKEDTVILTFEVEDTGIGIKEADLPKLSAEFERIEEDRNRNIEGSGLGMNITIQLLALLGSKLQVESVYGKGSKFYFELEQKIIDHIPIGDFEARIHHITENYNYNTQFHAKDAKILVVDDNAVNRKVLRNLLKETQIQITDVEKGIQCLELVQKNHYDLIFLDHMMPEMDGIETLHGIKKLSNCPCQDTPIIVLTANAVSGAKEKYLSEGFDDFLSKPIVPEKLEAMIKKMLPKKLLKEIPNTVENISLQKSEVETTEDFLESLPQVDGLDWHYAWLHLPEIDLLRYTVKEFYSQIDSAANILEESYKQITVPEQIAQYRIQVHAMKSLAATLGIIPLAGIAKVLEYAARDGKIEIITSMTTIFLEEWRSYRQKLQGIFDIGTEIKEERIDYSIVQALVEMIRISMQEMDIDQADQLINQLQVYKYPEVMEQNIQKLAEAVTNLDSEEADHLTDILKKQIIEKANF